MSIEDTGLRHDGLSGQGGQRRYLDQDQASKYLEKRGLRIAPKTLGKLRVTGGGPAYRKFGRKPIYDPPDLDAWVDQKLGAPRRSTSESG
jgi:hypothetical protein